MSELLLWIGLLGAELALILFMLLFVFWLRSSAAARRDRKALAALVEKVQKAKGEREKVITRFLQQGLGLQGDELAKAKRRLLRAEVALVKRFVEIYKRRNAGGAAQFQMHVESLVDPYLELAAGDVAVAEAAPELTEQAGSEQSAEPEAGNDEVESLRKDNVRLSEELGVTMETMARILAEYSTMFASGAGDLTAAAGEVGAKLTAAAQQMPATPGQAQAGDAIAQREAPVLDEQELDIGEDSATGDELADLAEIATDDQELLGESASVADEQAAADEDDALHEVVDLDDAFTAEELVEAEEAGAALELADPQEAVSLEEPVDLDEAVAVDELADPDEQVALEELTEPQEAVSLEEPVDLDEAVAVDELADPDEQVALEELTEPQEAVSLEEPVDLDEAVALDELADPQEAVALEQPADAEQAESVQELLDEQEGANAQQAEPDEDAAPVALDDVEELVMMDEEAAVQASPAALAEQTDGLADLDDLFGADDLTPELGEEGAKGKDEDSIAI